MTAQSRPLAEVTRRAIEVLARELGPADTLRFVNQFTTGLGDYTAEREQLLGAETLEEILGAIKARPSGRPDDSILPKEKKNRRQKRR